MKINDVCEFLEAFAPPRLAEEWDNVGLLVGDPELAVTRIMTCLTVTPESAEEALERNVNLIVSHHPLPFRPLKRITADRYGSQLLWKLIRQGVSIYSPHTSFDSAALGINQMLAERLKLQDIRPLNPIAEDPDGLGSGRVGTVASGTIAGRPGGPRQIGAQFAGSPFCRHARFTIDSDCGRLRQWRIIPGTGNSRPVQRFRYRRSPVSHLPGSTCAGRVVIAVGSLCKRAVCG